MTAGTAYVARSRFMTMHSKMPGMTYSFMGSNIPSLDRDRTTPSK